MEFQFLDFRVAVQGFTLGVRGFILESFMLKVLAAGPTTKKTEPSPGQCREELPG